MKFVGAIILVSLILVGVFTLANWEVLTAPTTLSFLAFTVDAPLGVLLLGFMLVLLALLLGYVMMLRTTMLVEARRHAQELQSQRKLAESAEASRVSELRGRIDLEFDRLRKAVEETSSRLANRSEAMEQSLRRTLEENTNSLSAHLGEVEDKLNRALDRLAD